MRILKAIEAALAAMALVVAVWCERAGKFVLRCLPGYQPPDPQMLVDQYVDAAETVPVTPRADERLQSIAMVADCLLRQQDIPDAIVAGLSDRTIDWLTTLDADMLIAVARAKPEDLKRHIAGTRTIRGLLAFDAESVEAYQQAVAREKEAEPELERIRRRPRRQEPLLPAFGPMG